MGEGETGDSHFCLSVWHPTSESRPVWRGETSRWYLRHAKGDSVMDRWQSSVNISEEECGGDATGVDIRDAAREMSISPSPSLAYAPYTRPDDMTCA